MIPFSHHTTTSAMLLRLALVSLAFLGTCISGWGHVRFEEPSVIQVKINNDGTWTATTRLDAEFIYLNAPEGWFEAAIQKRLNTLYWDQSVKGEKVREAILTHLANKIEFIADETVIDVRVTIATDPQFDYQASKGQSLWGLIEFSGKLPSESEFFRLSAPPQFYPLEYYIETEAHTPGERDFFEINSERVPRRFSLNDGAFVAEIDGTLAISLD